MTEKIYIRGIEMAKADDLLDKQETLVSGNNIKTINGTSILGSGDITISGDTPAIDLSNYITKEPLMQAALLGIFLCIFRIRKSEQRIRRKSPQ